MTYVDPLLPVILILVIASLVHTWRLSNYRPWLLSFSIAGVLIISSPVLAALFSQVLESRYDKRHFNDTGKAIVVLGGACETFNPYHPFAPLGPDSYSRVVYAALLYQSQPSRRVLVSGSKCTSPMANLLESEGVPSADILQEANARNTHENAVYASKMLRSEGIHTLTLVTDAKSMLRAELCFREEGLAVIPYPVGLGTWRFTALELVPSWQAMRTNSDTFHELMGLLWYEQRGWI